MLQDFNLTIKPGEKIGLVGRSGAGKSTVVNLLLRFFDLEGGAILIDGAGYFRPDPGIAALANLGGDAGHLAAAPLDPRQYPLRPARRERRGDRARRQARARPRFHPRSAGLERPRGYDAHVGERGVKLSGGQRQRIAIARVILKDAPILVFDEATSALDSEVEAAIQSSLGTLMEGKTVIAIAHRLSTIAQMDRLVVLEHGRIVEQGTPPRADRAVTAITPRCGGAKPAASSTMPATCRRRSSWQSAQNPHPQFATVSGLIGTKSWADASPGAKPTKTITVLGKR